MISTNNIEILYFLIMNLTKPLKVSEILPEALYLSQCPGKKVEKSRDTQKPIVRDLETDLRQLKSQGKDVIRILIGGLSPR